MKFSLLFERFYWSADRSMQDVYVDSLVVGVKTIFNSNLPFIKDGGFGTIEKAILIRVFELIAYKNPRVMEILSIESRIISSPPCGPRVRLSVLTGPVQVSHFLAWKILTGSVHSLDLEDSISMSLAVWVTSQTSLENMGEPFDSATRV